MKLSAEAVQYAEDNFIDVDEDLEAFVRESLEFDGLSLDDPMGVDVEIVGVYGGTE